MNVKFDKILYYLEGNYFNEVGKKMFLKKEDQFFTHIEDIATNLVESTNFFADYKLHNEEDTKYFSNKMKEFETKGDSFVHQVIKMLNNVFITPIEREDILALTMHMDDILDGLEHTAALFDIYSVCTADDYMVQFVDAIQQSVIEIDKAVDLLTKKKLLDIRQHAINIKDYESKCDEIWRHSTKRLLQVEKDPIQLLIYKEIYEQFEGVADSCEKVANTFEEIIMKNA